MEATGGGTDQSLARITTESEQTAPGPDLRGCDVLLPFLLLLMLMLLLMLLLLLLC